MPIASLDTRFRPPLVGAWRNVDVPPPSHAVEVRLGAREPVHLGDRHPVLADELKAVAPHHHRHQPRSRTFR
jgi:hypothetical protein